MSRRAFLLVIAVGCCSVAGCFSGEYKRRMENAIANLKTQGEKAAAVFGAPTEVVDANGASTGVALRLPVFVDSNAKSLVAGAPNAQPPFANLPGFAYSYELPFDDTPAYVYFAAVSVEEQSAEEVAQEVQTAIAKTFSNAAWQDVSLEDFTTGQNKNLQKLSVTGPQQFDSQRADGRFDLYLIAAPSYTVLVGWRAANATAEALGFWEKVAISIGTVTGGT